MSQRADTTPPAQATPVTFANSAVSLFGYSVRVKTLAIVAVVVVVGYLVLKHK